MANIYKILFDKKSTKELEKIPNNFRQAINEKIQALSINPRPDGCIKLKVSKKSLLYRIRSGDYRIVYTIQDEKLIILVIEVDYRRKIYR